MPYVPTNTTAYSTVTVTHTTTHFVTATPGVQSSNSGSSSANAFGSINNTASILALASAGFTVVGTVVRYRRGITSSAKIQHWRRLIKKWREWEQTLPDQDRALIMQENPQLIKHLDEELARLDQALQTLEWNDQAASTAQRYGYFTTVCKEYRHASEAMDKMEEVWNNSTGRYRTDHPFLEKYSVAYPDGVAPPPPGIPQRALETFTTLRAAIKKQVLTGMQAGAVAIMESVWAYCEL